MEIAKPDKPVPERHSHEKPKHNQVFVRKDQRRRGLWEKNGHSYGQFNIQGKVVQLPLHDALTVPDAETARQAIKRQIADGGRRTARWTSQRPKKQARRSGK
jgi:hypothetical protein